MDETIGIEKVNEVYVRLDCNQEQSREIYDKLSCFAENFMYHPRFKARIWNGKISFFDYKNHFFPIGLLPQLVNFCQEHHYPYKYNFNTDVLHNEITDDDFKDFYKSISLNENTIPRDYQDEAIKKAIRSKRGVIELATGGGKSLIIYCIIRFLLGMDKKILLVVPSVGLTNQMFGDFKEYGFKNIEQFTSILYSGSVLYDKNKKILISTWQSIYKKSPEFFEEFGAVIVDETHVGTGDGKSVQTVLKKCSNAEYRIGMTGTLPTELINIYTIYGYLGPKIYSKKSKELMDTGWLSNIKIANIILRYPEYIIDRNKRRPYEEEIRTIVEYEDRNKIFSYIVKNIDKDENILILCRLKEHQRSILCYLEKNIKDKKIYMIHGNTPANERENIRKQMEKESGTILLATYGTTSTGINIKKLHHVIFASSYKSKIKVMQSIGRGLRKHESKKRLILWDIIDDMTWTKKTGGKGYNFVYSHFIRRLKYYKDQSFPFINKLLHIEKL